MKRSEWDKGSITNGWEGGSKGGILQMEGSKRTRGKEVEELMLYAKYKIELIIIIPLYKCQAKIVVNKPLNGDTKINI